MKRGRAEVGHEVGHPSLLTKKEEGRRKTSTGAATAPELEKVSGVIGYLNRQAGTAFQAGAEGNVKLIVRLLRDGATSSDFKSVIDFTGGSLEGESQHDAESGSRPGEADQERVSTASMPAASSSPLGQPAEFPAIVLRQRIHDRALVYAHVGGEAIALAGVQRYSANSVRSRGDQGTSPAFSLRAVPSWRPRSTARISLRPKRLRSAHDA